MGVILRQTAGSYFPKCAGSYFPFTHIFGYMTNSMDAMHICTIGILRAAAKIGRTNLTYNMMRCVQLKKRVYAVMG